MNIAQLLMSSSVKSDVMQTGVANGNSVANFKNIYNQIVVTKDGGENSSIPLTNEELSSLKQLLQAESLTELPELLTAESAQLLQSTSLEDVAVATGLDLAQLQQILDKLASNNVTQSKTSLNSLLPAANNTYVVPLINPTQNTANIPVLSQQMEISEESMNQNVSDLSNQLKLQKEIEQLVEDQPKIVNATQLLLTISNQPPELQKMIKQLLEDESKLVDVTQLLETINNQPPELQKMIKQLLEDESKLVDVTQLLETISSQPPWLKKAIKQLVENQPKLMNEDQLIIKLFMQQMGERFPQLQSEIKEFIEEIPNFTDIQQLLQTIGERFPQLQQEIKQFVKNQPILANANQLQQSVDKQFSHTQIEENQLIENQPMQVDVQQLIKQVQQNVIHPQSEAASNLTDSLNIVKQELSKIKESVNEIEQQQFTNIEELLVWVSEKTPQLFPQLTASLKGEYSVTPKEAKQLLQLLKVAELVNKQTVSATNSEEITTVKVTELFSKIMTELQTMSEPVTKPKLQVFQQVVHRVMPKLEESVATETVVANTQSSKTETITITLPSAKPAQSEALLKEMQALLNKSQISNVAGLTKLAIKLYPENLGTIRIEIVQQNGVLTARLLASTSAGKELLDQNVHQLKQAFVQQNIQMERLDIAQSLQDPNRSGREQSFSNNFSNQQRQQEDDEQPNDEQEEVLSFKDLLATEEVD